jgi:hypothetical protein
MESPASVPLSSSSALTVEALNDVRDRLKGPPLTGRRVLIPLGSKAFVPGVLFPEVKQNELSSIPTSLRSEDKVREEECVTVRQVAKSDGTILPKDVMTRHEALDHLQKEIQKQSRRNDVPSPKTSSSRAQNDPSKAFATTLAYEPAVALPFMEIREEIDASGNETKAEALNVTEQLKMLQQGREDTKDEHSDVRAVPINSGADEKYEPISEDDIDPQPPRIVSNEAYAKISNRLEHLMLLEEQAQKPAPHVSKQKLGWSKGFLNADPRSKSASRRPVERSSPNVVDVKGANFATASKLDPASRTASIPGKPSNESAKGVSFHSQDSVQEIPRIGERSAREITQSRSPRNATTDAFSSSVVEKSSKEKKQHRNAAMISGTTSSNAALTLEDAVTTKKLSRFAQERLLQRQGHYN